MQKTFHTRGQQSGAGEGTGYVRDKSTIDENAGLEPDVVMVLAVVLGELADFRKLPTVERDAERRATEQTGREAGHGGQTK